MNLVASDVLVVGKDQHEDKNGNQRYALQLSNGTGNTLKLSCTKEVYETVQPLFKRYDLEANLDTVGYNIYGDILVMQEQ